MSAQDDFNAYQARASRSERTHVKRAKGHKPGKGKPHKPKKPSYLDDPSYVTRPLTLRDINRNADTAANLKYDVPQQALALQARQTPAWFEQYKGQVQGIGQGIQTGYQRAIDDVTARATATQTAGDTSRQQLLAQQQADAASRGATVDPSVFVNDANAATVGRQGNDNFASLLAAQQQAQGGYFGGVQAAAGTAQIAAQTQNADAMRQLLTDKGGFKSQYVTDAAQTEHKNRLEDSAFNLDTYKAQSTAAAGRSKIRADARKGRATAREKANTPYSSGPFAGKSPAWVRKHPNEAAGLNDKYNKITHPGKGKGTGAAKPLSAAGLTAKKNIRSGVVQLRKHDNGTAGYWQGAFEELTSVNGIDPVVARAIVQGARLGKIGPKTAKTLREDYGIDPKTLRFGKPKKRRKPRSVPDNAHGY